MPDGFPDVSARFLPDHPFGRWPWMTGSGDSFIPAVEVEHRQAMIMALAQASCRIQ